MYDNKLIAYRITFGSVCSVMVVIVCFLLVFSVSCSVTKKPTTIETQITAPSFSSNKAEATTQYLVWLQSLDKKRMELENRLQAADISMRQGDINMPDYASEVVDSARQLSSIQKQIDGTVAPISCRSLASYYSHVLSLLCSHLLEVASDARNTKEEGDPHQRARDYANKQNELREKQNELDASFNQTNEEVKRLHSLYPKAPLFQIMP